MSLSRSHVFGNFSHLHQSKWDPEHLHRHSDFVPIKREADALPTTTRDPNLRRMESHEDEFGSEYRELPVFYDAYSVRR